MESLMRTVSEPVGQEVHTPPCLRQNEQEQALAGISFGSGCQSSLKEMLPQWQAPEISMLVHRWFYRRLTSKVIGDHDASEAPPAGVRVDHWVRPHCCCPPANR